MNKDYKPSEIEPKWAKVWADTKLYKVERDSAKEKYYQLEFFPYPSGVTMHVGHVRNYVISDTFGRFKRMQGYNVLHPMGWDAFGLPAENQAIKTGTPPRQSTDANIKIFKRQLSQVGLSYDWDREIDSSNPNYYKWTQALFLLFFKRKLAYKAEAQVNWCPHDKTVLANEQVVKSDGKNVCERCGHEVEKRFLNQWFFKITEYADRLLADLKTLDWPSNVKAMQQNWIGRSEGARVRFPVSPSTSSGSKSSTTQERHSGLDPEPILNQVQDDNLQIEVFTTRLDTIYGVTFMVLAPEHPLVEKLSTNERKAEVEAYVKKAASETEIERQNTDRTKTGVFTGAYVTNPFNKEKIPVWSADYVLMGYGTGAIMAVPAHDARDYEFAQKFKLPIKPVVLPVEKIYASYIMGQRDITKAEIEKIGGSVELTTQAGHLGVIFPKASAQAFEELIVEKMEPGFWNEYIGDEVVFIFKHKDGKIERFVLSAGTDAKIRMLGNQFNNQEDTDETVWDWLVNNSFYAKLLTGAKGGRLINSGKYTGLTSAEARKQTCKDFPDVAEQTVNYKMRDWLISRQRYWGAPIPIIYCKKCGVVPVPEKDLPVLLPDVPDYLPDGSGRSPLAKVESFVNVECPTCGGPGERETDTMDTFVDSSWYFLRFADPHNLEAAFDTDMANYWLPVDTYVGGVEHAVAHLLFARFWTKVLADEKLINFQEPFKQLRNQGMVGGSDGRKMGKRYGNVVTPDDLINKGYGADALRLYEAFIGPYNQGVDWNPTGIDGTFRFIKRAWTLMYEFTESESTGGEKNTELETALMSATHRTIKKVTDDIGDFGFNTAVSALMELVNEFYKLRVDLPYAAARDSWEIALRTLTQLMAPFAPFAGEELWQALGGDTSVHVSAWPKYEEKYIKEGLVEVPVQVNGKLRGTVIINPDTNEDELKKLAAELDGVKRQLEGKSIVKTIVVPRKLVNFVVK